MKPGTKLQPIAHDAPVGTPVVLFDLAARALVWTHTHSEPWEFNNRTGAWCVLVEGHPEGIVLDRVFALPADAPGAFGRPRESAKRAAVEAAIKAVASQQHNQPPGVTHAWTSADLRKAAEGAYDAGVRDAASPPDPSGETAWVFNIEDEEAQLVTVVGRQDGMVKIKVGDDDETWELSAAVFATRAEAEQHGFADLHDRAAEEVKALREQLAAEEAAQAGFEEARQRAAAEVLAAKATKETP